MDQWHEFFRANFLTLLLFCLILILLMTVVHLTHHGSDAGNIAWGREQATGAIGAFLGLITGARLKSGEGK